MTLGREGRGPRKRSRRTLLGGAAMGAAGLVAPAWIRRAFAGATPGASCPPGAGTRGTGQASTRKSRWPEIVWGGYRRAQRRQSNASRHDHHIISNRFLNRPVTAKWAAHAEHLAALQLAHGFCHRSHRTRGMHQRFALRRIAADGDRNLADAKKIVEEIVKSLG